MLADSDNTGRVPARPLSPVSITARKLRSALRIDDTDPTDGLRHEQMAAALQSGWKRLGGAIPGLEAITEQAGSSVETRLPSPFLPAFEGSVEPLDGSDKPITSLSPGPLESPPRTAQQQGSPGLSRSSRSFALNAFTSSDPSVPGDSESKLVRADARLKRAVAELARYQALQASKTILESDTLVASPHSSRSPFGRRRSSAATYAPSGSHPTLAETPRRSRLARVLSPVSSPSSTPRGPPRLSRSPQLGEQHSSPSIGRRWSSTMQAILSPSPTLPQMQSPSPSRRDSPRFLGSSDQWQQWEELSLTEQLQRALSEYLIILKRVAETRELEVGTRGLRTSVLVIAMAISAGHLPVRDTQPVLVRSAQEVLGCLAILQGRKVPSQTIISSAVEPAQSSSLILLHGLSTESLFCEADVFEDTPQGPGKQQLQDFVVAYNQFGLHLVSCYTEAKSERREVRLHRRQARIAKASTLYGLDQAANRPDQPSDNIATLSSIELFQHALRRALDDGLFTADEVEAFEPRLLLTLPRLALLYGVFESNFPVLDMVNAEEQTSPAVHTALEVFLPRLCRPLPVQIIRSIRQISPQDAQQLASRLCFAEAASSQAQSAPDGAEDLAELFRVLATEADGTGTAGMHSKLMRKVLKIHLSENGRDSEAEDEVLVAKSMLAAAGLFRS